MQNTHQKFNLESWLNKQENLVTYFFLALVMCIQSSLYIGKYATSVVFFFIAIFCFSTAMLWVHKQVSYPEFRFLLFINSIFKFDLPIMNLAYQKNLSNLTKGMDDELKAHTSKIVNAWREYALFSPHTEINTEELIDWLCPTKRELTLRVFEYIDYKSFLGAFYYYVSSLSSSSRSELLNAIKSNKQYDNSEVLDFISLIFDVLPNIEDLNDIANYKLAKDLKFHLNGSIRNDNTSHKFDKVQVIKRFYQENQALFENKTATNGFMILFFSKFYEIDDDTKFFINQIDLKVEIATKANSYTNEDIDSEPDDFKL